MKQKNCTKGNQKILFFVILIIGCVCACFGLLKGVEIYKTDKLQEEKQQELAQSAGMYNTESIVLADTTPERAQWLAEMLQARLRITEDGSYAVLYLPEGVQVEDVYQNEEYKSFLSTMSLDYYVNAEAVDANNRELISARPSFVVTDELYPQQNYLDFINLQDTWDVTKGAGVTIAVIDSGIDTDHPDFAGRISERSYDATNDRIVSDYGMEVIEDEDGHGTSVAGVIAAGMNDGVGITGIAPEAELIIIKCETDGHGQFLRSSDLVFGLAYAIECDADVVNMSFGTEINVFAKYTQLAVDSDIICVAAAGNDGSAMPSYPAADENVIGVGAMDMETWSLANYSNYGFSLVLAPGTAYTTALNGGYQSATGTSISSPVVASAVALYLSQNPYTEFNEMCELLKASSVDLGILGEDRQHAFGALDIHALVCEEKGTITYEMLTDELKNQTQLFVKGHTIQYMPEPERANVVLDGWYYDMECTDEDTYFETVFTSDVTLYASWINEDDGTAYIYRMLEDGTVEIQSYTGRRRYLTVPSVLEGKTVSSIGEYAFAANTRLRSVTLPETLTNISMGAFSNCTWLRAIEIPENVKTIGAEAFSGCVSLSQISFMKNSALTTIGSKAFAMCGISTIRLPASLTNLGSGVFYGSTGITSIAVDEGNTSYQVLNKALYDKEGTTLLYYPAGLSGTYILNTNTLAVDSYAFAYSRSTNVILNEGIMVLGSYAFTNSYIRTAELPSSVALMGEYCYSGSRLSVLDFQDGIVLSTIPESAFSACSYLRNVTIPSGITSIKDFAFNGSALNSLAFTENSQLRDIGAFAFAGCPLSAVEFPTSVTTIGANAFSYCHNLKSVVWEAGSNLKSIRYTAFEYCTSLKNITLPDSLTEVGYRAFFGSGLEELTIGASLINLGDGAFSGCHNLHSISVSADNPAYTSVDGIVFSRDQKTLHMFPAGRGGSYTIPADTVRIADYAFAEAMRLTDVRFNTSLAEIGGYAFSQCTMLNTPVLPASLTTIGENAFERCASMSGTLIIPKSVISIGRFAFFNDYALTEILLEPESELSRIGYGTFAYCGITNFTVPGSVSSMGQEVFVGCKDLLTVTFEADSQLQAIAAWTFSGADELRQITFEEGSALKLLEARSLEGLRKLERIVLENCTQLATIDNYAFQHCVSLKEIFLPDSLTEIGRYAFNGCKALSRVDLPEGVAFIGRYAFNNANNLNVYFSASVLPLYLEENWNYGISGYYVSTAEVVTSGDWQYALTGDGKASIVAYTGSETHITLTTLDGHEIVSIGGYSFADNAALQSITLPDTLQGVYQYAFKGTTALQSITIPDAVSIIDNGAFQGSGLQEVVFGENSALVNLGRYAFADTKNLTAIAIPDGVDVIRDYAFQNSALEEITFGENAALKEVGRYAFKSSALKRITLPAKVEKIDYDAFHSCVSLTSVDMSKTAKLHIFANAFYGSGLAEVHIPAGVEYIGEFCFTACPALTGITVDSGNENYASMDGVLYNKAMTKLITCPAGITGSYTVPSSVTTLGFAAFEGSRLSEVVFPENSALATLGYRVFYNCDNLKAIAVPDSVQSIDNYAFAYCDNLQTVTFTENSQLSGIYKSAFYNNTSLTSISIPDSVQEIGDYAFYGCAALTELVIPENSRIKGIYDYAFAYSGVTEFTMPAGLLDIGTAAFQGAKLDTLVCNEAVVEIGDYAFADCGLANTKVLEFPASVEYMGYSILRDAPGIKDLTIPFLGQRAHLNDPMAEAKLERLFGKSFQMQSGIESLRTVRVMNGTVVGEFAFANCQNLEHVYLPDTITEIGENAFYGSGIKEMTLPAHVTALPAHTFARSSIEKIVFPDSLETIGQGCFEYCENLKIATLPTTLKDIGEYAFMWTGLETVELPASVVNCGDGAFSGCISLRAIEVETGSSDYTAVDGILYSADMMRLISAPGKPGGEIAIPEGVVEIGRYAFTGSNITGISLPNSLRVIDQWAFVYASLQSITIPSGVGSVGTQAFMNCHDLKEAELSSAMTEIPYGLFEWCFALEKVTIHEGITAIGNYAFQATALTKISLPATLEEMRAGAFDSCNKLCLVTVAEDNAFYATKDGLLYDKSFENLLFVPRSISGTVTVMEGVKTLSDGAFSDCAKLEKVILPDSLESIGSQCFYSCSQLNCVEVGDNIQHIGQNAFIGTAMFTKGNVENWENGMFYVGNCLIMACDSASSYGTQAMDSTYVTVRPNTRVIAEACFARTNIEGIKLPDSVEYINYFAFSSCSSLKYVRMSNNIKYIGEYAFGDCQSLHSIDLSHANAIDWAFYNCEELEYVAIGECIASFSGSPGLKCVLIDQFRPDLFGCFDSHNINIVLNNEYTEQAELAATSFSEVYTYAEKTDEVSDVAGEIYYRGEWNLAAFYADDIIVTMDPLLLGEVVQVPADTLVAEFMPSGAEFFGWDIDGDGLVDELPVTLTEDLKAHAVFSVPVTGIALSEIEATMEVTDEKTLSVSYTPSYYTTSDALLWTSSDETIATVDESGKITAVAEGTATITATLAEDSSVSASCTITVIPLEPGIRLPETSGTLNVGSTLKLEPRYVLLDEVMDTLAFTSADEAIATVDQTGIITAVTSGTVDITISCGEYTAVYTVTVLVPMEQISITAEAASMNVEETMALRVVFMPENTTDDRTIIWTSSDNSVAKVSESGEITAIAPGTVTIVAETTGGLTAEYEITVYAPIKWIVLNTTVGTLRLDRTKQLEVIYEPSNTTDIKAVTWSSSDPEIASVSDTGLVTGLKRGTAVITGQVGDHAATYTVTVIGLRDQTTGITITNSDDTAMDENVELEVESHDNEKIKDKHYSLWEWICKVMGEHFGDKHRWHVYDITLKEHGEAVQPDTRVDVEIPFHEDMDREHFKIYRVEEDGSLTDMTAEIWGKHAHFQTDHFSMYVIGAKIPICDEHTYGEWEVLREETCIQPGEKSRVCEICGFAETQEIPAHSLSYVAGKEATCTEHGTVAHYACSCGSTYEDAEATVPLDNVIINAPGHTEVTDDCVDPTCTATGLTAGKHCSVCDEVLVQQEEIPALGHTEEEISAVAPTCTAAGLTAGEKCSVCATTLVAQKVIPALDHSAETIPGFAATCTEDGMTDGEKCSVCDTIIREQTVILATRHAWSDGVCINCDLACEHDYAESGGECVVCGGSCPHSYKTQVHAPSCTEQGYTTYTCTMCGTIYNGDYVNALNHEWLEASCTVAKTCSHCGITEGEPNGHIYMSVITPPTCTENGYTTYTCACGDTYTGNTVTKLGHDMGQWTVVKEATPSAKGEEKRICSRCDYTETRELEYKVPGDDETIKVKHNLTLESAIDFSFYVPKSAVAERGLTATVVQDRADGYEDKTITLNQADWETLTSGGVDYWRIRYTDVAAKELTDILTLTIQDASGVVVTDTYSVAAYAVDRIENSANSNMKNLMNVLLHYGAAAQVYFNYRTDALANAGMAAPAAVTLAATANAGTAVKHNLTLESNIDFSFFVPKSAVDASGLTATVVHDRAEGFDDKTVTLDQAAWESFTSGGVDYWRIRYTDVAAKEIGDTLKLTVSNGTDAVVVDSYSVLQYAQNRVQNSSNQNMKALMQTLQTYGAAAQLYFNYK